MTQIIVRPYHEIDYTNLVTAGIAPLFARLYAARGIQTARQIESQLSALISPAYLKNSEQAAQLLADAVLSGAKIRIIADYDCDGATACAVAVRGLYLLGAHTDSVDYLVPNRFEYGYGLTPEIVRLAATYRGQKPDLLLTVDNGIASIDGVDAAQKLGIKVLITDHHLPISCDLAQLPKAQSIVNPNQPGCLFPSKHLAGVGVIFYVLLALRAELRARAYFFEQTQPNLTQLLDLVALGTVADVVCLDHNNRILVAQGLTRIRQGKMQAGISALFQVAQRHARKASSFDLGFCIGPRINAAGRLADMSLGIHCLLSNDSKQALDDAYQLNEINQERKAIESQMQQEVVQIFEQELANIHCQGNTTLSLYQPQWHQGVIGILASRLKEKFHCPTMIFARYDDEFAKGSGRSITGFHLRDALDLIAKREPDLLIKFGGHAMAAGVTLKIDAIPRFTQAFEAVGKQWLTPELLTRTLYTDGPFMPSEWTHAYIEQLNTHVWGQGFPPPVFSDTFFVIAQSLVKEKHLKLILIHPDEPHKKISAIWFHHTQSVAHHALIAYRLINDQYQGIMRIQMVVEYAVTV